MLLTALESYLLKLLLGSKSYLSVLLTASESFLLKLLLGSKSYLSVLLTASESYLSKLVFSSKSYLLVLLAASESYLLRSLVASNSYLSELLIASQMLFTKITNCFGESYSSKLTDCFRRLLATAAHKSCLLWEAANHFRGVHTKATDYFKRILAEIASWFKKLLAASRKLLSRVMCCFQGTTHRNCLLPQKAVYRELSVKVTDYFEELLNKDCLQILLIRITYKGY